MIVGNWPYFNGAIQWYIPATQQQTNQSVKGVLMTISKSIVGGIIASAALSGCGSDSDNSSEPRDTILPTVISIDSEGKTLTKVEPLTISFSETIEVNSVTIAIDRLNSGQYTAVWNDTGTQLSLTPVTNWPGGISNLTINAADLAGNELNEPYTTTVNANLTFELMQSAEVELGVTLDGDTQSFFLDEPFSNTGISNGSLWVSDYIAGKVHKFNVLPENSNTLPDETITSINILNDDNSVNTIPFNGPQTPYIANGQLIITDYNQHIVAIFNSVPSEGKDNRGIVLGEIDDSACSATAFSSPEAAIVADGKLIVVDGHNHRVLVWNAIPTKSHTAPDLVIGQNSFDSCVETDDNQDGKADTVTSDRTFSYPSGIWSDGKKLAVVESGRVLIWNEFPEYNFASADIVLGQESMVEDIFEDLDKVNVTQQTLIPYEGITSNGQQLFVTDSYRNRVLIWDSWPIQDYQAADQILGQSDFIKSAANDINQNGEEDDDLGSFPNRALNVFDYPAGLSLSNDTLAVSDVNNRRVLLFKSR